MAIIINGDIAFLDSGAVVTFTKSGYGAFNANASASGSATSSGKAEPVLAKLMTKLDIAPWGEDNRFPQNISNQLNYCGVAKTALDWKGRALYGGGIVHGTITGHDEKGNEIFTSAKDGDFPEVDAFMEENDHLYRFYLEFLQDWTTFGNCFPEYVMSMDGKQIKKLVHQESCDSRFVQMDDDGIIKWVLLSKYWGVTADQFVKFDPKKTVTTSAVGGTKSEVRVIDNKYVKQRRALDPYNALEDLRAAAEEGHISIIHPVQYPSTNKTYYQLAYWDGARMAGWIEIAAKVPGMLKVLFEKAFNLKYHIEIPESYMEKRYGTKAWSDFKPEEKDARRLEILAQMDKWLSGSENAYKTFVSYFEVTREGDEKGRVKITVLDNKSTIDKDLLASSAANSEILFAMQINPDLIGAGTPGGNGLSSGSAGSGSNIREAFLVYLAQLPLERHIILEPLRTVARYNGWDPKIKWRFRDIVLTTLDQNKGTEKKLS